MTFITIVDEKNPGNYKEVKLLKSKETISTDNADGEITGEQIERNIKDSENIINYLMGVD